MKKENPKLSGTIRTVTGRKVKQLRQQGQTPATIYGHGMEPLSVQFTSIELDKIFTHAGESLLVDVMINEDKYPVIFKNPQFHPVLGDLIHIDCYKVNLKEKIVTTVPLELVGESPAVKAGNVLVQVLSELEVEALPSDLPEKIEVNIEYLLEVGNKISISDLHLDEGIEIKNDPEQVIALIEEPKVEEEPVVEEVSPEDIPATAQKSEEDADKTESTSETNSSESSEN